jgi:hydrogenase expression/formation protein HypE
MAKITINHGSGYSLTHELVSRVFAANFGMSEPLTDSAVLQSDSSRLAFTTDSYVIDPVFFPGGDIGKLSVCGTVNDLAVSGAEPKYIAASFIIEEGFPMDDLDLIVNSMAEEATRANVKIVTGDTKVVERGKCDRLFITTSGIGILSGEREHISTGKKAGPGDKLIINGPVGNHAIAVLGARKMLGFTTPVISDCASLNHLIGSVLEKCKTIHFMRDLTRGGLAVVLNELASVTGYGMIINEEAIPVDDPVKGVCEILGFDPLYLANEGKVLFVVGAREQDEVLDILRKNPLGKKSSVIGEISRLTKGKPELKTIIGGRRVLDMPSGLPLPRIC